MEKPLYILIAVYGPHHLIAQSQHTLLRDAIAAGQQHKSWYVSRIGPQSEPWANDGLRSVAAGSNEEAKRYGERYSLEINEKLQLPKVRV